MKILELAKLVLSMRESQKRYFKERSPLLLAEAKGWEARVDDAVREALNPPQKGLFDDLEERQ